MADAKQLITAILRFLDDQQSCLDEENQESLDVAKQCLETAYGVTKDSPLTVNAPLLDVYRVGCDHIQPAAKPKEVSADQKQAGDKLKSEGNTMMKEEKFREALNCYTRAIDIDGHNAVYYCNRAAAFSKLNEHQNALEDCLKALEIDPQYSKAFGRKGLAHTALNQHHAARDCYKRALELDPGNETYKNNLQLAEAKIAEERGRPSGSAPGEVPGPFGPGGMNLGGMDLGGLLNNPALMNMASSMLSNPQMQQMMANMMSGQDASGMAGGQQGIEGLLQAGQALAQQMQQTNPELVDELRNRYRSSHPGDENPPPPPSGSS